MSCRTLPVGGATGAALTAIVMIFEMTLDYSVVLPMTVTVATSYGLRQLILRESIYTMKLVRRGHYMPRALQANAHLLHVAGEIAQTAAVLPSDAPVARLELDDERDAPAYVVLVAGDEVAGVVARQWACGHPERVARAGTVAELPNVPHVTVTSSTTLFDVLARLSRDRASVAVVLSPGAAARGSDGTPVVGIVTKERLADGVAERMALFGD